MAVMTILQVPDPLLRARSAPVADFEGPLLERLCANLEDTRRACREPRTVGLAAPQVGVLLRVLSLNPGEVLGHRYAINPEIIGHGQNMTWAEEGCMSIDLGRVKFRVRRWDTVTVRFQDPRGATHEKLLRGFAARVMQHEVDHLDGVLVDALARRQAA